jgi:cysteine synthase A
LKDKRPKTKIVLSEPINAQLIESGTAQERTADGSPSGSHPAFQPHMIQGWTPDFIPQVLQESIDAKRFDKLVPIDAEDGIEASKMLAQKEGIFTGISGGSTFAVALDIAKSAAPGTVILCMLPDTGERYLTSPLFADVGEDMNADELALSKSTPGFHLHE